MTDMPDTPAARRRRWISFAELIAVAGLAVAAASYWDSHRERVAVEREAAPARPSPLLLTATASSDRSTLALKPARAEAVVQTQTLYFPDTARAASVDITGDSRIESRWIERVIRSDVPKARVGAPPRLPVAIVTVYIEGNVTRRDTALYDVGYRMRGRWLQPYAVELEGITLVRRAPENQLQAAVQARWAAAIK